MAANDSTLTMAGIFAQETENPGMFDPANGNVVTSARYAASPSRNNTSFDESSACNAPVVQNESELQGNMRKDNEKPPTNKPLVDELEGAVGGDASELSGEMVNDVTDKVDGALHTEENNKGTSDGKWDSVKNYVSVQSCVDILGKEAVHKAITSNILGPISEDTKADEISYLILQMTEDNPNASQGKNAIPDVKIHDKGHPRDGSRHIVEVQHFCNECSVDGKKPYLMLNENGN